MKRLFISHASEDKINFVRPLVDNLIGRGLDLWYDNFELFHGDSIRAGIERGLIQCDVGLCILSDAYFKKKWTGDELGALFAKETLGKNAIIPIWHGIDRNYLLTVAPILADRLAINGNDPIEVVAKQVLHTVRRRFLDETPTVSDEAHRYFNPATNLPQLGYRFEPKLGYKSIMGQLRPRELLFAFWRHAQGHYCACHIGSESRFLEVAADAMVQFYAVDRSKVEIGLDHPLVDG